MSAELMKSKFVRRPSVVRHPSICGKLSLNLFHGCLLNIWFLLSLGHMPRRFLKYGKKYILGLFLPIFFVFVNMGPYGNKHFKTLLLLQITFESFQFFPEFSSQCSSQKHCFGFLKFWESDFSGLFFSFSLTWGPMGAKTSKHYSLKPLLNLFKLFMHFLFSVLHKSTVLNFWNFEFPIFHQCLNFTIVPYEETQNLWKTNDGRAKRSEIWASRVSTQCIQETFDSKCERSFWGHSVHFRFSKNLYLENGWS